MEELLRLSHIDYWYEERYPALKDVSATFCKAEKIAVLGNNGAGKSTFFLCMNGIHQPRNGTIHLKNALLTPSAKDISRLRQTVGLVFQDADNQIVAGTVENEVSFGPMNLRLPRDEVAARVEQSLAAMNLDGYQNRAPHYLSGGEKKRVSIADVLAMGSEMILFDEPTTSLDPEHAEALLLTLDNLHRAGITLVVSTHDVDFAYRFATRFILFSRGEIIADGNAEDILRKDNLLSQAGLKKPLLYAAAETLLTRFPAASITQKPKTIEEFERFADQIKNSCNSKKNAL